VIVEEPVKVFTPGLSDERWSLEVIENTPEREAG
jgi:hypothetical protein